MATPEANTGKKAPVGLIGCQVLEAEIGLLQRKYPQIAEVRIMPWGLHVEPDRMVVEITAAVREMAGRVEAVVLAYGRCQSMDRLPDDFGVPVFRPPGEDCIGVLMGQDRYHEELMKNAGTWFLTPGWTHLGMEFVFRELQTHRIAKKGINPMEAAKRMLRDFNRALLIQSEADDRGRLREEALEIARTFDWKLEETEGSLSALETAVRQAIEAAGS